jgi:hypothetical protein
VELIAAQIDPPMSPVALVLVIARVEYASNACPSADLARFNNMLTIFDGA